MFTWDLPRSVRPTLPKGECTPFGDWVNSRHLGRSSTLVGTTPIHVELLFRLQGKRVTSTAILRFPFQSRRFIRSFSVSETR